MKHIYYLKDDKKQGPISIKGFTELNLPEETLIWHEGLDEWTSFDLIRGNLIPEIPSPLPKNSVKKPKLKLSFTHYLITAFILSLILTYSTISYIYTTKKERLKNELISEIDDIFNGKKIVFDGTITAVSGELTKTKYDGKKREQTSFPKKRDQNGIQVFPSIEELNEYFIEQHGVYGLYKCKSGGFDIAIAERLDKESFSIEMIYSKDMGYKQPQYNYSYGFKMDNWRPSVQECYNSAFDYFKENSEYASGYTSGLYNTIISIDRLQNEYYNIENAIPKSQMHPWKSGTSSWEAVGEESISNNYWTVFYTRSGKNYSIAERTEYVQKEIIQTSIYSFIVLIALFGLIFIGQKILYKE